MIGSGKYPGLDGFPYELYLRLTDIFVPILTVAFNNCFLMGFISKRISRSVITLLIKGKDGGREFDYYMPITWLNAGLKFIAITLREHYQAVAEILVGPRDICAVKGLTVQINRHLIVHDSRGCKRRGASNADQFESAKVF